MDDVDKKAMYRVLYNINVLSLTTELDVCTGTQRVDDAD